MNAFEAWNLRLLEYFFEPGRKGKEVFIGTPPDVLDDLGADLGGDVGFLAAVKTGPSWKWKHQPSIFESRLLELVDRRRASKPRALGYMDPGKYNPDFMPMGEIEKSAPTYLPYLAALVRGAAVADGDGYYATLRKDLELPGNWSSGQMSRTEEAWLDLEMWTKATGEHFGKFTFRRLGGYQFVGLAKSQVMVAARDIPVLHEIFETLGLEVGVGRAASRLEDVLERICMGNSGVSKGLHQAARDSEYVEVLKARLVDIHGEWKGAEQKSGGRGSGAEKPVAKKDAVRFGLALGPNDSLPWRVIVGIDDNALGHDEAEVDEVSIDSDENGSASRLPLRRHPAGGWVVSLPAEESKAFLMRESWALDTQGGSFTVGQEKKARVLTEGGVGNYELWDSGWPDYGGAVVLFSDTSDELREVFTNACPEARPYEPEELEGLPAGWTLYYVEACERLTDAQRAIVEPSGRRVRSLALQGGSKIDGMYLHYDLPTIVYRGAPEWKVRALGLDAVELEEDFVPTIGGVGRPDHLKASVVTRYYRLPPIFERGGEFKLVVLDDTGKERGSCSLGVRSRAAAPTTVVDGDVCLDKFGKILKGEAGLRGGLSAQLVREHERGRGDELVAYTRPRLDVGRPAVFRDVEDNVAVLFLDSLARSGNYSYGNAKTRLDRLLARRKSTLAPWKVLLDLWRRGYVEIERSVDGGIERVHSVPANACLIPLKADGRGVLGLLGTLTLNQWKALCDESLAWEVLKNDFALNVGGTLPVLRLRAKMAEPLLRQRLATIGLGLLPMQGLAIANWAAMEREVRSVMQAEAKEISDSVRFMGLKRFDPLAVRYVDARSDRPVPIDERQDAVLYKFEDARRRGWHRTMFVSRRGVSVAIDEQWSKWIAMGTVARGLANAPVYHDRERRHLYVPAQLRLPVVLERALILCSGSPPVECRLEAWEDGRSVKYGIKQADAAFFELDEDYCQGIGTGVWLRYDNVPAVVMRAISLKGK